MSSWKLNRDEFAFRIIIAVEARYHLPVGPLLGKRDIQLVPDPVEHDQAHKQYGSSFPHEQPKLPLFDRFRFYSS
jgi:hypothetical protein